MMKIDETNKGKRVELIHANDPFTKLKPGSKGAYEFCLRQEDGQHQHAIKWDDGSSLMLLEGVDSFRFIEDDEDDHYGHHCENCGKRLNYDEIKIQEDKMILCDECENLNPEERLKRKHPEL